MTILRSGATKKYSDGWESAFGKKSKNASSTSKAKKKTESNSKKSTKKAKKRPGAKKK